MARRVTGRKVQCQTDLCPYYGKIWIVRPVPYKERGRLDAELFTWPNVFCKECLNQPAFIGYQEEEVRTGTLVAIAKKFICDNEQCSHVGQIVTVPMESGGIQVCSCGQQSRFTGYEIKEEEPQHEGKTD
jgi:hypothetical protein